MKKLRVLVACEFSGRVRDAFLERGHYAASCDFEPSESARGRHYQCDLRELLGRRFRWDMLIAFPPCTHLASSGARWFYFKQREQREAVAFVRWLAGLPFERIAIENPIGVLSRLFRRPDQIVQPWWFGHGETKATCWWLKGLPPLVPTRVVEGRTPRVHYESPGPARWKNRSRTLPGMARAIARQWGDL